MPPVPSECQALADEVTQLEQQYATLATQVQPLVGAPAWSGLAQLGQLRRRLTDARRELDLCVRTHSAALTGNVVVMDASGAATAAQQVATLWDLAGGGPVARETSLVQGGSFGFQGPLPAQHAVTIATTGDAAVTGSDYRSGPLQAATPADRFELVISPPITLVQADLDAWAAAFPVTTQPVPPGLTVTVATVRATLGQDAVTVAASGTVIGTVAAFSVPPTAFSGSVSVGLFPSTDPAAGEVVSVALAGSSPVQIQLSGSLLGAVLNQMSSLLVPQVSSVVWQALDDWSHGAIQRAVADVLTLGQLPPNATLTLRNVSIRPDGISFQPALGAVGTALSTFHPPPIPPP